MDCTLLPIWGSAWLKPVVFLHIKLLNRILVRALLVQDWKTALRILSVFHSVLLARSRPIFPWEPLVEVLRRLGHNDLVTKYLLALSAKSVQHRETAFMELILNSLQRNNVTAAYDQLISRIHLNPYRDNPLFHFYAGMIQFSIWDTKRREKEIHSARMASMAAIRYFTKASKMDNEILLNCLPYYLELLLHNGMLVKAERLMYRLCKRYPNRLELHRLRTEFYFSYQIFKRAPQLDDQDSRTNTNTIGHDDSEDSDNDNENDALDTPSTVTATGLSIDDDSIHYNSSADSLARLHNPMTLIEVANEYFTIDPTAPIYLFKIWVDLEWTWIDMPETNLDQLAVLLDRLFDRIESGDWSNWMCCQLIKAGLYARKKQNLSVWNTVWQPRKSWWPRFLLTATHKTATNVRQRTYQQPDEGAEALLICQIALCYLCFQPGAQLPPSIVQTLLSLRANLQKVTTKLERPKLKPISRKRSKSSRPNSESEWEDDDEEEEYEEEYEDYGYNSIDHQVTPSTSMMFSSELPFNQIRHLEQTSLDTIEHVMLMLNCCTLQDLIFIVGVDDASNKEPITVSDQLVTISSPNDTLGISSVPTKLQYVDIDLDIDLDINTSTEDLAQLDQAWQNMHLSNSNNHK
ncbi:hypothetical protein BDF19DRAFT_424363 [Syncephalis fuscata]|nr:hypothetical protein BDF19DRAFT_424363 [Syncephalis fuscata]